MSHWYKIFSINYLKIKKINNIVNNEIVLFYFIRDMPVILCRFKICNLIECKVITFLHKNIQYKKQDVVYITFIWYIF